MTSMTILSRFTGILLLLTSTLAQAWWHEDWGSRRQVTVDTSAAGADTQETLHDFPLLIRLHGGNFGYFTELAEGGHDLRFVKGDSLPLKHQVEKLDVFNEMGLVWVRLPEVAGGSARDPFWLYYGNAHAADGSDAKGLYDTPQTLVYHFAEGETLPQDATAYATHAASARLSVESGGWIGAAARFDGTGSLEVNAAPQLAVDPGKGWTFSTWIKLDQPQSQARILEARDAGHNLELSVNGLNLSGRWQGAGAAAETPAVALTPGQWHQLSLVVRDGGLSLFVDGTEAAGPRISLTAFTPQIRLGVNFVGWLDEVGIASAARSTDWIKLGYRSQTPDFAVIGFGPDESGAEGGTGHFSVIVENVTLDGWVVIGLTGIMLVVALLVMITKALVINRISRDNRAFMAQYRNLDASHLSTLDREETEEIELAESDLLSAVVGKHDHFQSSTLYHLYHAGIRELRQFVGDADTLPVPPEAWNLIRVRLDSQVVRESQRLNSNMVLLTIAIAGGPFLGLLGTVMGVMITFAVIAATGDVNINSIAPGIAAALLATVAGLAVAIPSLFAYNYLLTRIKDIIADMRVFTDEFLALLAVRVAIRQRESEP